jgi:hypothetical protein
MNSEPLEVVSSASSHGVSEAPKEVEGAQNLHLLSKAIEEDEVAAAASSSSTTIDTTISAATNTPPSKLIKSPDCPVASPKSEGDEEPEEDRISSPPTEGEEKTSVFIHQYQMTPLPKDFAPGPYDVLCGRGRVCKDAPGNRAYRDAIMNHLQVYVAADTKLAKGNIISGIMETIRQNCYQYHGDTFGGFIKCVNGQWYDVGDFLAREKTSQCFRDALAAHYSSSAQSKYLRRRARDDRALDADSERATSQPHAAASPEVRWCCICGTGWFHCFRGRTVFHPQPSFD